MTDQAQKTFDDRVRYYAEVLNNLFDLTFNNDVAWLFEFVCTLVRSAGVQDAGWDSYYESEAVLDDLQNLSKIGLPAADFPEPELTRIRLALLSYCHVTEMDLPYSLVANLLGLRLGKKYNMSPFADLAKPLAGKKKEGLFQKTIPPSPGSKIRRIKELAEQAFLPKVAEAFEEIHDSNIRNAFYHSDYVLHDGAMHLLRDYRISKKNNVGTPVIEFDELDDLFNNAFAFYSALFSLYERCRRSFTDFKDAFVPYDTHYKGLLELMFDTENRLIGYRVYWPNNHISEYHRTKEGCNGLNISFNPDGSMNFFVGLYASKRGAFSPLVEETAQPLYPCRPGTDIRPQWPDPLKPYKLPDIVEKNPNQTEGS